MTTYDLPKTISRYDFERGTTITAHMTDDGNHDIKLDVKIEDELDDDYDFECFGHTDAGKARGAWMIDRKLGVLCATDYQYFNVSMKIAKDWEDDSVVEYRGKKWVAVYLTSHWGDNGVEYVEASLSRVYTDKLGYWTRNNYGRNEYRYCSGFGMQPKDANGGVLKYTDAKGEHRVVYNLATVAGYAVNEAEAYFSYGNSWWAHWIHVTVSYDGTDIGEASLGGVDDSRPEYLDEVAGKLLGEALNSTATDTLNRLYTKHLQDIEA